MDLIEVTKEKFYATVGPLNVYLRSERDATYWETPHRELIGKSTPGYMGAGPKTYSLRGDLLAPSPAGKRR